MAKKVEDEYFEDNGFKEAMKALGKFHTYEKNNHEPIKLKSKILNGFLNGGLRRGRITQIAAASGTGKSTIALQMSREICQQGLNVLYVDAEQGVSDSQIEGLRLTDYLDNTDKEVGGMFTVVSEVTFNSVKEVIKAVCVDRKIYDVVIIDSIGVLSPGADEDLNIVKVGGYTRYLKALMNTLNQYALDAGTTFVMINHTTPEIGAFIPKEKATGGRAPEYYSGIILQLSKFGSVVKNSAGVPIAQKVYAEAVKSRYGMGKSKLPFYVFFGKGISDVLTYKEILENKDVAVDGKVVKMLSYGTGNSHLYLNGKDIAFRGKDNAIKVIKENFWEIDELFSEKDFSVVDTEALSLMPEEQRIESADEVMIDETEESEE